MARLNGPDWDPRSPCSMPGHARHAVWWRTQWRHNGRDTVSNHQRLHCLLNCLLSANQRKRQSSASLAFVRGSHRSPVNSPHKGPATRKMFYFDDVIMSWHANAFRITDPLWGESIGDRWFPLTKGSNAELLCFLAVLVWTNNRIVGDLRSQHMWRHCTWPIPGSRSQTPLRSLLKARARLAGRCHQYRRPGDLWQYYRGRGLETG